MSEVMSKSEKPILKSPNTFRELLDMDNHRVANGTLPKVQTVNGEVHQAFYDGDLLKATGLSLTESVHPFLAAMTLTARGDLGEAQETLAQLDSPDLSEAESAEIATEKSRIHGFLGEWQKCIDVSSQQIERRPTGVTLVTLLMIRAVAHFEIGNFSACENDLKKQESLLKLYPNSISAFYHNTLKVRLLAVTERLETGARLLTNQWEKVLSNPYKIEDEILSLLRSEITLRRHQTDLAFNQILGCHHLALALGEDLYVGFSLLELHFTIADDGFQKFLWQEFLQNSCGKHVRIRQLFLEAQNTKSEVSPTGHQLRLAESISLQQCIDKRASLKEIAIEQLLGLQSPDLIFPQHGLFYSLRARAGHKIESPQILKACSALSQNRLSKASFFQKVWEQNHFSAHLHDPPVKMLLTRMRQSGIQVRSEKGQIFLANSLVID